MTLLNEEEVLDPINSFQVSDKVRQFREAADGKNPRVKYLSFVSQKKGGPSKMFAAVAIRAVAPTTRAATAAGNRRK